MGSPLHPRNVHRNGYDFVELCAKHPPLTDFVVKNPSGHDTVNFHDPAAVKCLNQALLLTHYALDYWDIPPRYLCPAVPGRADYIHHLADLLKSPATKGVPKGDHIRCLDIGVGANCIYPIIGSHVYRWSFVGTDIDKQAIAAAKSIVAKNTRLKQKVAFRHQADKSSLLEGIVKPGEVFDLTMCNPPFYRSVQEAKTETQRKLKGLGASAQKQRNFAGQANELWYPGGELAFVRKLIQESTQFASQCYWFTTLVAKGAHVDPLKACLHDHQVANLKIIPMSQGQKQSRILAWTFLREKQRKAWEAYRFKR